MATVWDHLSVEELEERFVEPQGCGLDGWRTQPPLGRPAAGLGSVEGDRLVDPEATSEEPEIGHARRSGGI